MFMEVNRFVEGARYLVLSLCIVFAFLALMVISLDKKVKNRIPFLTKMDHGNSILELLQKGNFTVVAAMAASMQSYDTKQQQ